jgi:MoaA/NifB/PqqE/SkfB family radical SAM enzyme
MVTGLAHRLNDPQVLHQQGVLSEKPSEAQVLERVARPKVDIIWNITRACIWDCAICCVDAVQVRKLPNGLIEIRSDGLQKVEHIPFEPGKGTAFEQAVAYLQRQGRELDFAGKLRVLDHLEGFDPKIDFSGGDPMAASENFEVMRRASERYGRDRITLTATGAGLKDYDPDRIGPIIGELNFTFDNVSLIGNSSRPAGYASGNLRKAAEFARAGVRTRAECPLSVHNIADDIIEPLYLELHEQGIDRLLLMRLFPSGRGVLRTADIPTLSQYRRAIDRFREMEARYGKPTLRLQCAMRGIDGPRSDVNPCDMVRESFGLRWDGTLLASPWAIDPKGDADEAWVLGNLASTPMSQIMASPKVQQIKARLDENAPHCKFIASRNSTREDAVDRMFDRSDPLYTLIELA